jgi:hypothetical protein
MGAGIVGGFLMPAAARDTIPVPIAVVITTLSVVSAAFPIVALARGATALADAMPGPAQQAG